mmetsp:Transcript_39735/g.86773  ORF Transcript_39735/g.86773 Transcript_39735/m.86773 type:complete len:180 (-) Transcript_39735:50-589(-)
MHAVAAEVARRGELSRREVVSMSWAYARARVGMGPLAELFLASALVHASDMGAQELANVCWALTTVRWTSPALLDTVAARAQAVPLVPRDLVNMTWAMAMADHRVPFVGFAAEQTAQRFPEFSLLESVLITRALSQLGASRATQVRMAPVLAARAGELNAQGIVRVAVAMAAWEEGVQA